METTNKLFYSGTKFFTENEEDYRITVRISGNYIPSQIN